MHVGNAFSALQCQKWADNHQAKLLLRIEDIDFTRCKASYSQAIIDDLRWLGIHFESHIRYQSEHLETYQIALSQLQEQGLIYPCFCTRKDIQQSQYHKIHHIGDDALSDTYPGTCRGIAPSQRKTLMQEKPFAWRLDIEQAQKHLPTELFWMDECSHQHMVNILSLGDFIIARKDISISYHLAVVIDDAVQGITHVIRGQDLFSSTAIHRLLQALLNLPSPIYQHHTLLQDVDSKRLAKRNQSTTLESLRKAGLSPNYLQHFLQQQPHIWPFEHHAQASQIVEQLGSYA